MSDPEKNATKDAEKTLQIEDGSEPKLVRSKPARAGKFQISMDLIDEASENLEVKTALTEIFSRCIVFRAEALYYAQCIEYQAFAAEFDELTEGSFIPFYEWIITVEKEEGVPDRRTIEVKRLD